MRSRGTIKRLKMYKDKVIRNKKGKVIGGFLVSKKEGGPVRIAPNRKWFGNTRIVSQEKLTEFRNALEDEVKNPYSVLLKQKKIPMGLLTEDRKGSNPYAAATGSTLGTAPRGHILEVEPFESVFGPKGTRKRPNVGAIDMASLVENVLEAEDKYSVDEDTNIKKDLDYKVIAKEGIFKKGQSRRIWGELYKVIDSSDVILQVLDARDPMGTRSARIERHLKEEAPHKHLVLILNKCDLVPTWVTARWIKILSKEHPTLAFHASISNSFGKGALIQLLRQFARLHSDKPQISVGMVGYPNVGKSSIINTLKAKVTCPAAPIPGETKVWRYVTLMRRIYLIDCPGVVYESDSNDSETDVVLKGVVRITNLQHPEDYIPGILDRVKKIYLQRTYEILDWTSAEDFLVKLARKYNRLLKGNEPDTHTTAKMVLNDWMRGKIPFFVKPPFEDDLAVEAVETEHSEALTSAAKALEDQAGTLAEERVAARLAALVEAGPAEPEAPVPPAHAGTDAKGAIARAKGTTKEKKKEKVARKEAERRQEAPEGYIPRAMREKERKMKEAAKEVSTKKTVTVEQMLSSMPQSSALAQLEPEDAVASTAVQNTPIVNWDDVFAAVVGEEVDTIPEGMELEGEDEQDELDREEEKEVDAALATLAHKKKVGPVVAENMDELEEARFRPGPYIPQQSLAEARAEVRAIKERKSLLKKKYSGEHQKGGAGKKRRRSKKKGAGSVEAEAGSPKKRKRGLQQAKEPRMTTNKKKTGARFYDEVNVKNRRNWTKTGKIGSKTGKKKR